MKQITPEIKQSIAALYYGQNIMQTTIKGDKNNLSAIMQADPAAFIDADSKYFLNVFDLSSITDEDCEKVHRMYGRRGYKTDDGTIKGMIKSLSSLDVSRWDYFSIEVWDYLRSEGYALPAFGFSVNHLVAQGVFKLKEVNND